MALSMFQETNLLMLLLMKHSITSYLQTIIIFVR